MDPKKKGSKQNWVRTGGAIGDNSMDKLDQYHEDGGGVDETVEDVEAQPNAKFLNRKKMARHID